MRLGKTEKMIRELVESIVVGQPRSLVVAHTHRYALDLRDRVLDELAAVGITPGRVAFGWIFLDEQVIEFVGVEHVLRWGRLHGRPGVGEFWDHAAFEHASIAQQDEIREYFRHLWARDGVEFDISVC